MTKTADITTGRRTDDQSVSPGNDSKAEQPRTTVLRRTLGLFIFLSVAGIGSIVDLATKSWAFRALGMPGEYRTENALKQDATYWVWPEIFGFQTSLNPGALFGMAQGQVFWLSLLSLVALLGVTALVIYSAWRSRILILTLGMIVAGILGNLYDRLGLHGLHWNYSDRFHATGEPVYAVRDWILVMIGSYHWPNFNIADSLLVCGTILLVVYSFFFEENRSGAEKESNSPVNTA